MAFATTNDIKTRLELATFSTEATAAASALLDFASAVVSDTAGKTEAAITTQAGNALKIAKGLTIELVCRALASPQGLSSASETLGAYSRSEEYRRDLSSAVLLTKAEELVLRKAVHGRISDSVMIGSHYQEVEA